MRTRRALIGAGMTVLALLAASCGDSDSSDSSDGDGSGAITVTHEKGTEKLDEPATKVVALEWTYVEDLLALGVTPVGVADIDGYNDWVTAGPRLPESVEDVGTRQEPSIERIKLLEPDLIVTDRYNVIAADDLESSAPLLVFNPYKKPQLESMKSIFKELAKAVGKSDKADAVLSDLDGRAQQAKDALAGTDAANRPVVFSQGYSDKSAPVLRLFTSDAMVVQIAEMAGLKNGWQGKADEYGMTTVGVEALSNVGEVTFLYVASDEDNIFTGGLAGNATWKSLEFVRNDRAIPLDPGTWFFGGPLSAMQILDETAKALGG